MNVQYALKDDQIYILEVNPRASRTVPFVAKVVGIPIAKIAARVMAGESLASFHLVSKPLGHVGVKEAVFPFRAVPRRRYRAPVRRCARPARSSASIVRSPSPSPKASSVAAPKCRCPAPSSSRCAIATSRALCRRRKNCSGSASNSARRAVPPASSKVRASRRKRSTRFRKAGRHRRCDQERRHPACLQHNGRGAGPGRFALAAPRRAASQSPLLYDARRGHGRQRGDRRIQSWRSGSQSAAGLFCLKPGRRRLTYCNIMTYDVRASHLALPRRSVTAPAIGGAPLHLQLKPSRFAGRMH